MSSIMYYKSLLAVCLALSLYSVRAEVFEECANAQEGSFMASWDSCQSYVYCDGDDSLLGQCDEGEYFDSEAGACDAAENVKCFLDEVDEPPVPEQPDEPPAQPPLEPEPTPPTMDPPGEVDILNVAPVVKPSCPFSDDPSQVILMASNASCTAYYLCYHGHAMEMHCTNELYFNANTGQCDYPENVQCAVGLNRKKHCLRLAEACFFPHAEKCSYYYYCIKGYLTLQQCPFQYGWDTERRSCVHLDVAKCYGSARRA
ncbi:hypothetical protein KR222_006620 [Zaprionus bogoriensis]|nr:hypothetical protein KR222_006620 [Zaprionus bogoriensis]